MSFLFFFILGIAKGFRDTLQFHPDIFFNYYPKASKSWWGPPSETWKNKENYLPVFVWMSDSWHFLEMVIILTTLAAIGTFSYNWYLLPVLYLIRQAGFHLVYTYYFK